MSTETELFKNGKFDELWQRCCGFIDLDIEDFMRIQQRLLLEQIEMLRRCELGRFILNGSSPNSVDEFRRYVPLTTYDDYAPYLIDKRDDALPDKPVIWQYTSGKSGEYSFRWAPVTAAQLKEIKSLLLALVFFSGCKQRKDIVFKERDKALYGMAPPPYATGTMARVFPYDILDFMPPMDEAEKESFEQRISRGFELALSEGLDVFLAMSSVTVAIGERFSQKSNSTNLTSILKRPKAAARMIKGMLRSRIASRPLLPRDLWDLKGLITFGIDSSIYKDKIEEMWGVKPLEFHGCTEAVLIATQLWDHNGMTFFPNLNFFEFIPEEEAIKSKENPAYQPNTLLMDEVTPGNYELIITSLHGGPFVRYRLGHLINISSLRNDELNVDIPQMNFLSRIDDQIDIAGFTRLSEKTIWQAIENAGLTYSYWTVRKEVEDKPILHLYIETNGSGEGITAEQIAKRVHKELKKLDIPYAELEAFTGLRPIKVTVLPNNTFKLYKHRQEQQGGKLDQLTPPHLNPSNSTIETLLNSISH